MQEEERPILVNPLGDFTSGRMFRHTAGVQSFLFMLIVYRNYIVCRLVFK